MTSTASPTPATLGGRITPGSRAFVGTLAACMAVTALAIDSALPAFPDIREAFGLADDATSVTGVVTAFFIGSSLGLLPAGLLADRFGRRPVMWVGLALYVAGAVASVLAPSLTVLFIARFVWGLGSAGPRVAAMAMVRDSYDGEQMAKQMSLIMAVFILVPTFAPALAAGVLVLGPWEWVFGMCAVVAIVVSGGVAMLPETLPPAERRQLAGREVAASIGRVLRTPGSIWYLVGLSALFGSFLSYLASSEIVLEQVFDLGDWFPLFFGVIAVVMGGSMYINSRYVERVGLERIIKFGLNANLTAAVILLITAIVTDGTPPFLVYCVMLSAVLFFQQMVIPNINAGAMRPLGAVAGTGSALFGMIPGVFGAIIGGTVDRQFDGTVRPLATAFVASSLVASIAWRRAWALSPQPPSPIGVVAVSVDD